MSSLDVFPPTRAITNLTATASVRIFSQEIKHVLTTWEMAVVLLVGVPI
ncbi:MAG: hypothetical protein QW756_04700 [Nitrososphaerota archaeon]